MQPKTAAIVIIGDEILSGKFQDKNSPYLISELRRLGVALNRILVIPDDVGEIAAAVKECASRFDYVFTSGGVGPTHDDVTIEAVASAFGRDVVRQPELVSLICELFGEDADEPRLRMADTPEGSELIQSPCLQWPVLAVENVYVMPGVPEIFRHKFEAIRERFRAAPCRVFTILTLEDEFDLALRLKRLAAMHPAVRIGSYPSHGDADYRVMITLDALEESPLRGAARDLVALLDPTMLAGPVPALDPFGDDQT